MKVFLANYDLTVFIPDGYLLCGDSLHKKEIKFLNKEFKQNA